MNEYYPQQNNKRDYNPMMDPPMMDDMPNPGIGTPPEQSLALERYLAEQDPFMDIEDPLTHNRVLLGNIPKWLKRRLFGLNGKHVINSWLTEKDLRVRKLKNFKSRVKEEMFEPITHLNDDNGRMLLDLDQAWIMHDDLASQARDGAHSKQRTTITSISMAGRMDQQSMKDVKQQKLQEYWV